MATRPKAQTMSIDELMRDGRAITAAAKRAVRRAVAELDRDSALSPAATKKTKKNTSNSRRAPKPTAAAARAKRAKPVTPASAASSRSRSATKRRAA